jgi:hypothetical protein
LNFEVWGSELEFCGLDERSQGLEITLRNRVSGRHANGGAAEFKL